MKNILLLLSVTLLPLIGFTQDYKKPDEIWVKKYENRRYTAYTYLNVAEKVGWIPRKDGLSRGNFQDFAEVFEKMCANDSRVLNQLRISGLYYCGTDHEYLMSKYNRLYKPVTKETWDEYCPELYTLMYVDEAK